MNIFVNQYSTLPLITFPITEKIMRDYNITDEMMENIAVTFSMYSVDNDEYVILNKKGDIWYREDIYEENGIDKYTLTYKLNKRDTSICGKYECEFKVSFLKPYCHIITLPNKNKINLYISDSHTKVRLV